MNIRILICSALTLMHTHAHSGIYAAIEPLLGGIIGFACAQNYSQRYFTYSVQDKDSVPLQEVIDACDDHAKKGQLEALVIHFQDLKQKFLEHQTTAIPIALHALTMHSDIFANDVYQNSAQEYVICINPQDFIQGGSLENSFVGFIARSLAHIQHNHLQTKKHLKIFQQVDLTMAGVLAGMVLNNSDMGPFTLVASVATFITTHLALQSCASAYWRSREYAADAAATKAGYGAQVIASLAKDAQDDALIEQMLTNHTESTHAWSSWGTNFILKKLYDILRTTPPASERIAAIKAEMASLQAAPTAS